MCECVTVSLWHCERRWLLAGGSVMRQGWLEEALPAAALTISTGVRLRPSLRNVTGLVDGHVALAQ